MRLELKSLPDFFVVDYRVCDHCFQALYTAVDA